MAVSARPSRSSAWKFAVACAAVLVVPVVLAVVALAGTGTNNNYYFYPMNTPSYGPDSTFKSLIPPFTPPAPTPAPTQVQVQVPIAPQPTATASAAPTSVYRSGSRRGGAVGNPFSQQQPSYTGFQSDDAPIMDPGTVPKELSFDKAGTGAGTGVTAGSGAAAASGVSGPSGPASPDP